jgi:hypothetical protein
MTVIPKFERLKEDHKFEVSLDYIERPCLKTNKQTNKQKIRLAQGHTAEKQHTGFRPNPFLLPWTISQSDVCCFQLSKIQLDL